MFKKYKHLSAAVALAGGLTMMAGGAQASVDNWDFNASLINGNNGFIGFGDQTGITDINISGQSTVVQTFLNGSADGQPFTDNGQLTWTSYNAAPGGSGNGGVPVNLLGLGNSAAIYLDFSGLTGIFNDPDGTPGNGDEFITFDPGAGIIRLVVDADDNTFGNNPGTELVAATFEIKAPSGGSDIDFFGGLAPSATIDVTLEIVSQLNDGINFLFEDENGNPLQDPFSVALANVNAVIDPNTNPNPNPLVCPPVGLCDSTLVVNNGGQFGFGIVPEPATLGLMGAGFIVLGAVARRRRKAA